MNNDLFPTAAARRLAFAALMTWLAGPVVAQAQTSTPAPQPAAAATAPPQTSGPRSTIGTRPVYTLPQIAEMARQSSPLLAVGRAEIDAAQAGTLTARAYPNPELGLEPGRLSPRTPAAITGSSTVISIGQPLENPWLREARLFDVYRPKAGTSGGGLAPDERSLAVRLVLNRDDATLTEDDIETTVKAVLDALQQRVAARLRA